jgi:hypothetical protein
LPGKESTVADLVDAEWFGGYLVLRWYRGPVARRAPPGRSTLDEC